jgi:hypothetical protein
MMGQLTIRETQLFSGTVFTTYERPIKLECYITVGMIVLPGRNTLAYRAHS